MILVGIVIIISSVKSAKYVLLVRSVILLSLEEMKVAEAAVAAANVNTVKTRVLYAIRAVIADNLVAIIVKLKINKFKNF